MLSSGSYNINIVDFKNHSLSPSDKDNDKHFTNQKLSKNDNDQFEQNID